MVRPINRKLRRDLGRHRAQFTAVGVTVFLGVMAFVATMDSYSNLQASYDAVAAEYHFANLTLIGGDAENLAIEVASVPGVALVEARTGIEVPFQVGENKLLGRVVGIPVGHSVNQLEVSDGAFPTGVGSILADTHMAEYYELNPGDTLALLRTDGWVEAEIAGVALSPEYIWPARDRNNTLTTPDNFGVVYMPQETAETFGPANEVVVYFESGEPDGPLSAALTTMGESYGALASYTRAEQASNAALSQDIKGFEEMAALFPLIFLSAAAMAAYMMISRMVHAQRPQIGVLLANGVPRREVLTHYLKLGLVPGLLAAVPAVMLGSWMATVITEAYVQLLAIPIVKVEFYPLTILAGLAFGFVTSALSALAPAIAASRIQPAAAMRGETLVHKVRRSSIERLIPPLKRLPIRWRMALRSIERNPRRTTFTMLGVVLALMVMLVSWGMIDTIDHLLYQQLDVIEHQDATVHFTEPLDGAELARFAATGEVDRVEPILQVPVVLESATGDFDTVLIGMDADPRLHVFLGKDGSILQLPGSGLLVDVDAAKALEISVGDSVSVVIPLAGVEFTERVEGLLSEPLGSFVYTSTDRLEALAGMDLPSTAALVSYVPGVDGAAARLAITEMEGVAAFEDGAALAKMMGDYMGLFYLLVGVMFLFGAAMAFALIFNSMSVNIAERTREIGTLLAVGIGRKSVSRLITAENLLVAVMGIPFGLVAGYYLALVMMRSFGSDMFSFDLYVRPTTFLLAAASILVVAVVSQWPGLRAIRKLNIPAIVKERSA